MKRIDMEAKFIEHVFAHPKEALEDYRTLKEGVENSKAIYKGKPIPFLYMPRFLDAHDVKTFRYAVDGMMTICQKVIKLYKSTPEVRKLFGFDARLEALILKENPYSTYVPMARFDIFYYEPGVFKFCELNTDGTSAMNEDRELAAVFAKGSLLDQVSKDIELNSFDLFDTWVHEVKSIYLESKGKKTKPMVAIVDFFDKASSIEFEVFKERFLLNGMDCVIADARDLTYSDGLYFKQQKIDIVYRRLVTKDMMDRIDQIPAFEKACLDDQTLVIGNIQSQVVHTKKFFQLLHDDRLREHLTSEDLKFIDAYVPVTESIKQVQYRLEQFVKDKNQWLIKPLDYYASIGVYAGQDYTEDEWRQLLMTHQDLPYLIQSYCNPPVFENIDCVNGILVKESYKHITGLFVYNGKFYGVYSRAGRRPIISGLHDVFTLPSLYCQE